MTAPELGWTTSANVIRAVDGDTIEVEIRRRFLVRINNLRCPEKTEPSGQEAKAFTDDLLTGKTVIIQIPTNNPLNLLDWNSFNRAVANIWLDNESVRDIIISSGYGQSGKKMGMD